MEGSAATKGGLCELSDDNAVARTSLGHAQDTLQRNEPVLYCAIKYLFKVKCKIESRFARVVGESHVRKKGPTWPFSFVDAPFEMRRQLMTNVFVWGQASERDHHISAGRAERAKRTTHNDHYD
jgi:hypothetical protein